MKRITNILIITLVSIWASSCLEKYWPEIDETYLDLLVVDGTITNKPGPYTVNISKSSSVDFPQPIPLSGYYVEIRDNQGNSEVLTEVKSGVYQTNPNGIQGVVGRSYQIRVQKPDGTVYESDYENLNEAVPIDQLYGEIESKQDTSLYIDLTGYQFYIDLMPFTKDTTYLLWNIEQTYEYDANLPLTHLYYDHKFHPVNKSDTLKHCWKTSTRPEIFTFAAENSQGQKVDRFALHYVSTRTKELSIRYSILVKQLSVNRKAHIFWSSLNNFNTGDGSIYAQQPYQLRANIYNRSNPEDIVLGYFLVAGSSSKRIYLNRPTEPFYYETDCIVDNDAPNLFNSTAEDWPLFISSTPKKGTGVVERYCFDCREAGGKLEKPDFWVGN